jgi:ActR/RegA family two-component response regulator
MKRRLVLLYTRDRSFDRVLSEALFGTGAIVRIARSVGDALQVVSSRGRELDFAILDFNNGCRGMTLLSAVHTCYERRDLTRSKFYE